MCITVFKPIKLIWHGLVVTWHSIEVGGGLKSTLNKIYQLYQREGISGLKRGFSWMKAHTVLEDNPVTCVNTLQARLQQRYPQRDLWYCTNTPEVSIVVLNYNKPALCYQCINSIWLNTSKHKYEIILVDNGSDIDAFASLLPLSVAATLVRIPENCYFGEGNNIGFEQAKGRFVVFLNNDVEVTENWLSPLISYLQQNKKLGAVGPKLIYPDGTLQEAGGRIYADGRCEQIGKGRSASSAEFNVAKQVDYISAAAIALKREVFEDALGFDLCYEPAYFEDADLCLKIAQLGYAVQYCPASTVIHAENMTTRHLAKKLQMQTVIQRNKQHFVARWQSRLSGKCITVPNLLPKANKVKKIDNALPKTIILFEGLLVKDAATSLLFKVLNTLQEETQLTLVTSIPYSKIRFRTLARDLNINIDKVTLTNLSNISAEMTYDKAICFGMSCSLAATIKAKHYLEFANAEQFIQEMSVSLSNSQSDRQPGL